MNVKAYWYIQFLRQVWQNSPTYGGWKSTGGDTFKIALLTSAYVPNQDLHATVANLSGEVVGQGYTEGGQILTNKTISSSTGQLILGANPITWSNCIFTARWAVIYDDTNTSIDQKQIVRFVDFSGDISLSGETLKITFDGLGVIIDITQPVDTTPPELDTASINGPLLALNYDEAIDPSSVPATSAFFVEVNDVVRSVVSVAMTTSSVTLTLATAVVSTDVATVSYTVPATSPIRDAAGNPAAALTDILANNITEPVIPGDVTPPALQSAEINGSILALSYDEQLNPASVPTVGSFQVFYSGIARTVTSVTVQTARIILVTSPAAIASSVVTLNYTAGANPIEDVAGNDAANLSGLAITNNTPGDTTAPVLTGLSVNASILTLTYNEPLISSAAPTTAAYGITVNGTLRPVTVVSIVGAVITLTLSSPVTDTSTVRASYTAPAANPVQDLAGNDAANFLNLPVTNATPPAVPTDAASFISQSIPSLSMLTNANQTVTVAMRNDGTAIWSSASGYHLYSQNPAGNTRWGLSQVPVQGSILESSNCVFSFPIVAPSSAGTYGFQWRMRHTTTEFGSVTPNVNIVVSAPSVTGNTYYVSTEGSDTGNTGAINSPFRTIAKGLSVMVSGDTLILRAGLYTEAVEATAIPEGLNANNPTVIKGMDGETVTIRPTTRNSNTDAITVRKNYTAIRKLTVDADNICQVAICVRFAPASVTIEDVIAKNGTVYSIHSTVGTNNALASNLVVRRCTVGPTGQTGIYMQGFNLLVEDCIAFGSDGPSADNGIRVRLDAAWAPSPPPGNYAIVRRNRVFSNNNGINLAVPGAQAYNNVVYNNIVGPSPYRGIYTSENGSGTSIYNNTIVNSGYGIRLLTNNNVARNNILYQNSLGSIANLGSGNTAPVGGDNVTSNPLFVNQAGNDYHLLVGSPAINAGIDLSSIFTTDFDGVTRTLPFDSGAYEFVP